jgi:DNA invertase Pin-like site-specific DNA recombinase
MFQMLGVFAEFERAMIRERVMAGLSRANADGIQSGRRRIEDSDAEKVTAIVAARAKGPGSDALLGISGWAWERERCCG